MAKFKVGDRVKLVDDVKAGTAGAFTLYKGTVGTVEEVQSVLGKEYMVEFPEGSFYVSKDKIAANSTSTNPVVQNALAAKNAMFKVGDRVVLPLMDGGKRVYTVGEVKRRGDPGWYLVVDDSGSTETVRWDAMKPARNADYGPKFRIDAFLDSDGLQYAKDGVGEIAAENPNAYEGYAKVDPRGKKIAELIRAAKQFNQILRKF